MYYVKISKVLLIKDIYNIRRNHGIYCIMLKYSQENEEKG